MWDNENFSKILKKFVRYCLFIHLQHILKGDDKTRYSVDVLENIKSDEANKITKDLQVLSLSGLGIANNIYL
jgi:hypothetical protein